MALLRGIRGSGWYYDGFALRYVVAGWEALER